MENKSLLKLTSIEVVTDIRKGFDGVPHTDKISMAKLLNRAMYLYANDEDFKKSIRDCKAVIPYNLKF